MIACAKMPDWEGESDDDETIKPWFNDEGDFQSTDIEEELDDG